MVRLRYFHQERTQCGAHPLQLQILDNTLLPKLVSFYDNCVAPESVSPIRSLGLAIRDLSKKYNINVYCIQCV